MGHEKTSKCQTWVTGIWKKHMAEEGEKLKIFLEKDD